MELQGSIPPLEVLGASPPKAGFVGILYRELCSGEGDREEECAREREREKDVIGMQSPCGSFPK